MFRHNSFYFSGRKDSRTKVFSFIQLATCALARCDLFCQGLVLSWIIAMVHKGAEIEALIQGAGAKLIYLPPYSPEFNPIENCWSKIKSLLRSMGARSYPDLAQAIQEAFAQVSLEDIRSWFTHCCYCTSAD